MMYGLFEDENRLEAASAALGLGANKYQRLGTTESLRVGYSKGYFGPYSRPDAGVGNWHALCL